MRGAAILAGALALVMPSGFYLLGMKDGIERGRLAERPAVEVRLVGMCQGRYFAALEESAFPAGCLWIAPLGEIEKESN